MVKTAIDKSFLLGVFWIFIGAILFSTKAIIVKLAYRYEVDSISLLALRMLFSLPFYLVLGLLWKRNQSSKLNLSRKDYWWIIIAGVLGYYGASLFDFLGLQYVTAGIERLVLYVYPTIVLLLGAVFFKQRIKRTQFIALLLTYLGVAVAFLDKAAFAGSSNFWLGVLLVFAAAFTYAIYIVLSGQLVTKIGTRKYTAWAMIAACVAVLSHHAISHQLQLFDFEAPIYWYGFIMAVFATVLPSFAVSEGIRIIGSSNAAIVGSIGPISTIVLAYFFLGEVFGSYQAIGTLIVIIGVLWLSLSKA